MVFKKLHHLRQLSLKIRENHWFRTLVVTKLLEHIAKLEAEKEQIQIQAADLAANAASATQLNKAESDLIASQTKYSNLENAYKMLKDKHLKLIDNHAGLLRSSSSGKGPSRSDRHDHDRKPRFVTRVDRGKKIWWTLDRKRFDKKWIVPKVFERGSSIQSIQKFPSRFRKVPKIRFFNFCKNNW